MLNFASFRTAYDVTMEALSIEGQFRVIMVTAEGIPERLARTMNQAARDAGVTVIGPATVGAIVVLGIWGFVRVRMQKNKAS